MKIAIAGTGWGARVQVPAFRAAGFEIVGLAGRDAERTREVAARLDAPPFETWEEMFARSGADWVSIVTPPSEHRRMSLAALERGLNVLCEKPTALNAGEASEMLAAAGQSRAQYALIDHELRFLPTWIEARRRIRELGELRLIEVRFASPGRGDPEREWNWWSDASRGGGVWGAVGSHMIDAVRYLAGEIVAVSADLRTTIASRPARDGSRRAVTSDDTALAALRIESGAVVQMVLTVVAAVDEETSVTFHGSGGGLRLRDHLLDGAARSGSWSTLATAETIESPGNSKGGPFGTGTHLLARAIAEAERSGDATPLAPAATFEDGLRQQRVLDAGRESSRAGGVWISVAD